MKYNNYKGNMEELISQRLIEIQHMEQVKILYAVESGSRAWGFASPDSDYDVRFIYVRDKKEYLKLESTKDFLDWELNETLDINGWDLSKVLQHLHKSNAVIFEWLHSPIVYYKTPESEKIKEISQKYFSSKSSMYHYYGTANKNYDRYLLKEQIKYKKYFYALRPILACKWIEQKKCSPPVLFSELVEEILEEEMKQIVQELIRQKAKMTEDETGKRLDKLNGYIKRNIEKYKEIIANLPEDRNPDWQELNRLFLDIIRD